MENLKKSVSEASEIDGFGDLNEEDQAKVTKAWEDGEVAAEDIPESAKKTGEEEEKPKAKKAPAKKKAANDSEGEEEVAAEKPKKRATTSKVRLLHQG